MNLCECRLVKMGSLKVTSHRSRLLPQLKFFFPWKALDIYALHHLRSIGVMVSISLLFTTCIFSLTSGSEHQCLRKQDSPVALLPTGFDTNASKLFVTSLLKFQGKMMVNNIIHVEMQPLTWKAVTNSFWNDVNNKRWETDIFQYLLQYVNSETFFIDLGAWIGPTIMYAGQLSRKAIGIEGDPAAFAELITNLNLNHKLMSNIFVQPGCVSYTTKVRQMRSAKAGNSCSGLGKVSCGEVKETWSIQCYDLRQLFKIWKVPVDLNTLIKIDIEGYECTLLSNLSSWLMAYQLKPTLLISMHGETNGHCSPDEYRSIHDLLLSYRYNSCYKNAIDTSKFVEQCSSGNLVLSDYLPPILLQNLWKPGIDRLVFKFVTENILAVNILSIIWSIRQTLHESSCLV